jgi:hypothetical protein
MSFLVPYFKTYEAPLNRPTKGRQVVSTYQGLHKSAFDFLLRRGSEQALSWMQGRIVRTNILSAFSRVVRLSHLSISTSGSLASSIF